MKFLVEPIPYEAKPRYPQPLTMEHMERMRIPSRYIRLEDSLLTDEECRKWLRGIGVKTAKERGLPEKGMYVHGKNGIGKTAFLAMGCQQARRYGHTALFVEAHNLKSIIFNRESFDERESMEERMQSVDVLALDDLGKEIEDKRDYQKQLLDGILRSRTLNNKITLLSTNVVLDVSPGGAMEQLFWRSTIQLLKDAVIFHSMSGDDLRKAVRTGKP